MSKLKFDLAQNGLLCVMRPWQAEIMRFFWRTETSHDSRSVYDHLQTADIGGAKSRAAIINFLNRMVDEGFLDYVEKTTKGGYKRVYSLRPQTVRELVFRETVYQRFLYKLDDFRYGMWLKPREDAEG